MQDYNVIISAVFGGIVTMVVAYFVNVKAKEKDGETSIELAKIGRVEKDLLNALEKIADLEKAFEDERKTRLVAESRLKDVKTAFGMVYGTLETMLHDNEDGQQMLGKLKQFIET